MWTHLDLFSGIGGFALACEWVGIETIGFVEIDKFCQKVLRKHWTNVPIVEDIHDIEKIKQIVANAGKCGLQRWQSSNETEPATPLRERSTQTGDAQRFNRGGLIGERTTSIGTVDLITGGFPCQPFSVAGKQRGKEDNRYLWPAMLNVIKELQPTWVIGENVAGIVNMELNNVLSDLENAGYEVQSFVIPSCAVNAPHRRDRVWIIAHSNRAGNRASTSETSKESEQSQSEYQRQNSNATNTSDTGLSGCERTGTHDERQTAQRPITERFSVPGWNENWYEVATEFCGISNGFPNWLDKNGGLINANATKSITRQEMSDLWNYIQSDEIQRAIGECFPILATNDLFAVVRKLKDESDTQDYVLFEGKAIQENIMRRMSVYGYSRYTPSEWEHQRQQTGEYTNTLSPLSYEIALAAESLFWWYQTTTKVSNRVDRLKSLGNAIVPQVAYEIIKNMFRG